MHLNLLWNYQKSSKFVLIEELKESQKKCVKSPQKTLLVPYMDLTNL